MEHNCLSSYVGNWELVNSIVGTNFEEAMYVYILMQEIGYIGYMFGIFCRF